MRLHLVPREERLARTTSHDNGTLGIALTAAAGFALGLAAGVVAGEMLGDVDRERVKRMVRALRRPKPEPVDPAVLERAVMGALRKSGITRRLMVRARALGHGIVELTGTAPDEISRQRAADLASGVGGVATVINRVLVEGTDLPPRTPAPVPSGA